MWLAGKVHSHASDWYIKMVGLKNKIPGVDSNGGLNLDGSSVVAVHVTLLSGSVCFLWRKQVRTTR